MQETTLEFSFKGRRDYVQGPDIYNAIVAQFQGRSVRNLSLSVHGFVKNNRCILIDVPAGETYDTHAEYPVNASLEVDGIQHHVFLTAAPDARVDPQRVPFDEALVVDQCEISEETIVLQGKSPFSLAETAVSMKKALLQHLYPDVVGKWVFVKIELKEAADPRENLAVRMVRNLNFKIIKSNLLHKGALMGNLYFSLVA